jgi:hypothetical protein
MIANIWKYIQSNDMIKIALILVGVYLFITYINPQKPESLENITQPDIFEVEQKPVVQDKEQEHIDKIVAGEDKVVPEDLLPKYDEANEFARENPVTQLLKEQNFLISGYHVGINTVMQSNKIPYHDIRSLPPIPKESVGPWNQSSYEQSPAQMRRFFEIGV